MRAGHKVRIEIACITMRQQYGIVTGNRLSVHYLNHTMDANARILTRAGGHNPVVFVDVAGDLMDLGRGDRGGIGDPRARRFTVPLPADGAGGFRLALMPRNS